jgi:hypothetical protein
MLLALGETVSLVCSFQPRLVRYHVLPFCFLNFLIPQTLYVASHLFSFGGDQVKAKKEGYDNVLYLDAIEGKYLEEVGTSNVFVVKGKTIHTPGVSLASVCNLKRKGEEDQMFEAHL